ncbi:hypothetical protein ACPCSQ_23910 [Streptomyces griseoincarnatus]
MDASTVPRHALEPEAVIADAVGTVEPALDPNRVRAVVTTTFPVGTQRRRLAALLQQDPSWLTQGRPQSPAIVDRFIQALIKNGAARVQPPRCGVCGEARRLVGMLPDSETRICGKCERVRRDKANPCAV